MPRYSYDPEHRFKPFRSLHQHAHFFGNMTAAQYKHFQSVAHTRQDHRVHPGAFQDLANHDRASILAALAGEHRDRRRGRRVGGGIWDAITSVGSWIWDEAWGGIKSGIEFMTNPASMAEQTIGALKKAWNVAQHVTYPLFHDSTVSAHSSVVASAIQQSYVMDETKRADYVGTLVRDSSLSSEFTDTWVDSTMVPPQALISVRGSSTPEDWLIDDLMIGISGKSRNKIQGALENSVNKYADQGYNVTVSGHSLGTSLIAMALKGNPALEDKIDRVDFYNPSTSPLLENVVSEYSTDDKFFWNMNMTDVIGFGQFDAHPPENLVMLGPFSQLDPTKAHGLDQWIKEKPETGQLDDSAKENIADPSAGWSVDWVGGPDVDHEHPNFEVPKWHTVPEAGK